MVCCGGRGMEQYFPLCSIEKPKSGTKQDEKSFPSSTSLSSVHISLWWKIHSSCGLYPFVYFWQHFIFAAVPCSLFHHFLLNKINNYVEWTQRKFLNCFTAEIFFIEPIFFTFQVSRWKFDDHGWKMKGLEKCESRDSFSIENKLTGAYDLGHKRRLFGEYFNFNL